MIVIVLIYNTDSTSTRLVFLFILLFVSLIIKYLTNNDTLAEKEEEADEEADRVLIGRLSLQVEDGGSEAPDPDPWTGEFDWLAQWWLRLTYCSEDSSAQWENSGGPRCLDLENLLKLKC